MSSPTTNGKDIAKIKREKYLLKQQRKLETREKVDAERNWVKKHSSFVTWLEIDDVKRLRQWRCNTDKAAVVVRAKDKDNVTNVPAVNVTNSGEVGSVSKFESSFENVKKRKRNEHIANEDSGPTSSSPNCGVTYNQSIDIHLLNRSIGPFLDLRDKNSSVDDYRDESGRRIFIAEGTTVAKLLIERTRGSVKCENSINYHHQDVISIIIKPQSFFDEPVNLSKTIKESFPSYFQEMDTKNTKSNEVSAFPFHIFLGDESVLTEIAGFHISRGALGCGLIPHRGEDWLYTYLERKIKDRSVPSLRILALDQISDSANLGSLIRSAAAFGIDCVVLSHDSCDAWYRRAVRVSMGHCFSVPSVRVSDLASCISTLRDKFEIASYAAVVDASAEIILEEAVKGDIEPRWCCVLGNEGCGISSKVIESCKSRIRIGMIDGVDSLSIGVAGAILLHGMRNK